MRCKPTSLPVLRKAMASLPLRSLTLVCAAVVVSGCALHEPPASRDVATPSAFQSGAGASTPLPDHAVDQAWWQAFGSASLDRVIAMTARDSLDVAAAYARVRQAQALARIAGASLLPSLDGNASASRQGRIGGNADVSGTALTLGVSATYELDFWGANRAARDSALAQLRASAFDRDTVRLTATAGAANLWLALAAARERASIATQQRDIAAEVLRLVRAQARAGQASPLDLAQQEGLYDAQLRNLAARRQDATDSENTLAVLTGHHLGDVPLDTPMLDALTAPAAVASLPSDLLTRRPDIARAEAVLAASDADVLEARARMLPSISLTGGVGFSGGRLNTVLENPIYSVAASLSAPIFHGGALAGARDLRVAQREAALADYRKTIVAAFGDVEASLNAIDGIERQQDAQQRELTQARTAFTLAQSRYRAGADTLLTLLDTQRTLFTALDLQVQLRLARLQASVALYKALGGGWQMPGSQSS
ncbi:Multidrug/solvent efflux pump outer membrane protein MepC [Pandoraea capi]|uniref:Multidrug/solvent efflux pump outer membrane protein MepC n=1 Tax=Pandoraea capi TaxID=2508286 RepID=A0ABY6W1V8_9BURK|nr:efflux transporter outer membrane subunit [Pandoraea capi]VVE15676.1 Multidrug/solvent efflux pump outer membrane protein MepC [Pandoraea capi]